MKKILIFLVLLAIGLSQPFITMAQVTTASISGSVTDNKGESLPGATVVAIHTPSGTRYAVSANAAGRYTFPAVRVGGPFTVTVTFVGFQTSSQSGIQTNLGTASNVNFVLTEEGNTLDAVQVTSSKSDIFSSDRTGAATTLGTNAISNLPTLGRSLNSITKYNAYGNGTSFAGQDSRFNNITIDGSVFNNGFGLGNDAAAGGRTSTSAFSLDAIEQIQINVAPFDIKQSGFAGAGINAVTRSGTNEFSGSVYGFKQNNNLVGKKVDGDKISLTDFSETSYGFRLGGPILKNKLFFFVNGEFLNRSKPALDFVPAGAGLDGTESRTTLADLEDLSAFMKKNFNYDFGSLYGYNNDVTSKKFITRLDYNLNDRNKLTLRYSQHDSEAGVIISNSNSGNTAGFGNRNNLASALSPENAGYIIQDNTRSIVGEWNSTFSQKVANNLIVTYNKQIEDRKYRTEIFPTIEIQKDGSTYTSFGFDPFSPNNRLDYSTFNITNNVTVFAGKHTFTFGGAYEHFKSNNLFFYANNGVWTFNSIDDFKTAALAYLDNPNATTSPVTVRKFDYRYSLLNNGEAPWQRLKVNTTSLYAQDEYQVSPTFKLTLGLRGDYIDLAPTAGDYNNPVVNGLTFKTPNGADYRVNTSQLPKGRFYISPRVGFNYDVNGDKTTQIRGGSGLFLSRMPYVLISNQLGNNGVNISGLSIQNTVDYPFTLDPSKYRPTTTDITKITGYTVNFSDPDLKFPQIWKTNLAVDQKLPWWGLIGTVEGIFNKNFNAIYYEDVNLKSATAQFAGADNRDRFPASATTGTSRYINSQVNGVLMLTNTNKGYSYTLTAKVEKPFDSKGFGGMLGYTYGKAKDLSSVSSTVDLNTASVNGLNYLDVAYANNDLRHRFVGFLSKRFEYGGDFGGATTFTLGMTSNSGYKVSYIYANDLNGDGVINDLLYIPKDASEIQFTPSLVVGSGSSAVTYNAQQQSDAFFAYINGDEYLSSRKGQYTERNGGFAPWLTRFDLTAEQDFYINVKGKRNTLRFRADILNFGNLLNDSWGVGYLRTSNPLTLASVDAAGKPLYRLATQTINGKQELIKDTFVKGVNLDNVFQIQLGLRYIFN